MEKSILLIDDDPDELGIFTEALDRIAIPINFSQVRSAMEALSWLQKNHADFIFIDFDLPKMNGIQCLEKIRKRKKLNSSLCVLYSNYIDEEMNNKAIAMGAVVCMKKPYMTGLLATKLKSILSRSVNTNINTNFK